MSYHILKNNVGRECSRLNLKLQEKYECRIKKKIIMYKWESIEMFIINIIDDIIVIIIITINHIMFQDLYELCLQRFYESEMIQKHTG